MGGAASGEISRPDGGEREFERGRRVARTHDPWEEDLHQRRRRVVLVHREVLAEQDYELRA